MLCFSQSTTLKKTIIDREAEIVDLKTEIVVLEKKCEVYLSKVMDDKVNDENKKLFKGILESKEKEILAIRELKLRREQGKYQLYNRKY